MTDGQIAVSREINANCTPVASPSIFVHSSRPGGACHLGWQSLSAAGAWHCLHAYHQSLRLLVATTAKRAQSCKECMVSWPSRDMAYTGTHHV